MDCSFPVALSFALSGLGDRTAIGMGAFYVIPQRIAKVMKKNPDLTREEAEEILAEKTTPATEEGPQNTLLEALAKPVE